MDLAVMVGSDDPLVMHAMEIVWNACEDLALIPDEHRIVVERLAPNTWGACGRFHASDAVKTIFINPDSPAYRHAMNGDYQPLACLLLHEQYHVAFGPAEAPAYRATLAFAEQIGARPDFVALCERQLAEEEQHVPEAPATTA